MADRPRPAVEMLGRAHQGARVYQAAGDLHIHETQVRATAAVMHTLPRDTAAFTGREDELATLVDAVIKASASGRVVAIHAIDGMAGIGKTTLAVHAGHLLADRFPEGQYFLRLHAHTPGQAPVESSDALASLLAADGVPLSDIPTDLDSRAALWRHRLAGRRVLLILDDAVGHHQVEPLLPGTKECLVVITSRRRLAAIDVAVTLPLDVLQPGTAVELFRRLVGRDMAEEEHEAAMRLVALCGYLPLAISLLAANLRHHPSWTAVDLLADLKTAHDRLTEMHAEDVAVTAAFETSYRDLESDQQQLFQRLSLHPGVDFDAYIAAALTQMSLAEARNCLGALYGDHLLDEPARGRYQMHDLVRDYAGILAGDTDQEQRDAAVERLLDYFQYTAAIAGRHVATHVVEDLTTTVAQPETAVPDIPDQDAALTWLSAEHGSLLACADFANQKQYHSRLIQLVSAIATFLRHAGPWDQAVRLHGLAVAAARRINDRAGEAGALVNLGVISFLKGDYQDTRAALTRALDIYGDLDNRSGQAEALTQLGTFQRLIGEYQGAIDAQLRALTIYRDLDNRLGQAYALTELGTVRPMIGDYPGASEALAQALEISRDLGDRFAEAYALNELGTIRHFIGDYPAAADALTQALKISRDLGDRFAEAYALNEISLVRQFTGDYVSSNAASTRALEIYRELGSRLGEADALNYLGTLSCLTEEFGKADDALSQALQICRDLGDRFGQARALTKIGNLRRLTMDYPGAEEALAQAVRFYRDLGHRRGEAEATNNSGMLLLDVDEPDQAMHRHRIALELARETHSPFEEARALEGSGMCANALGDVATAINSLQQAAAIYQQIGSNRRDDVVNALAALQVGGR